MLPLAYQDKKKKRPTALNILITLLYQRNKHFYADTENILHGKNVKTSASASEAVQKVKLTSKLFKFKYWYLINRKKGDLFLLMLFLSHCALQGGEKANISIEVTGIEEEDL